MPAGLTDEVLAALRERGVGQPVAVRDGQVPYHVAVGSQVLQGAADRSTVAAVLRGLAAQLEEKVDG